MMRPTPDQERWLVLAARFARHRTDAFATGGWRRVGWLTRIALFVLGLAAAAMLVAIAELLHIRPLTLVPGLALIITAEGLIATRRLNRSGIEEALSLAGMALLAFWIVDSWFEFDDVELTMAVMITFGIAGWRLCNALFTTLSALAAALLIYFVLSHLPSSNELRHHVAALFCYAVAWAALALGAFKYRRPSVDHRLDWLVVIMPIAGYLWSFESIWFDANGVVRADVLAMPILLGISALWTGLQRRQHAALLACMGCVVCVAYELREVSGWSLTQRLLVWGVGTLVAALLIERRLRTPLRGVTSTQLNDHEASLDWLQMAGAAVITPKTSAPDARFEGEGGGFGGGGASGRF